MRHIITEAIVLAGGLGTRLRALVADRPKPMAEVRGRPFLEYLFDHWISQGIQRFVVSTGYRGEVIQQHFGGQYKQADISYVHESIPRGTGGALKLVLSNERALTNRVVLLNGDTWFPADLRTLSRDHDAGPVCMCVTDVPINTRYGSVLVSGRNNVTGFSDANNGPSSINTGVYSVDTDSLRRYIFDMTDCFSFESDVLKKLVEEIGIVCSHQHAPFLDIGVPDDYLKARDLLPMS